MKPLIAFIDDDRFFSRLYIDRLSKSFEVLVFSDAGKALESLPERTDFSAIVVDVMMPAPAGIDPSEVNDGLDTGLWLVEKLAPWLKENSIPVIVFSNRRGSYVAERIASIPLPSHLITVRSKIDTPPSAMGSYISIAISETSA